MRSTNDQPNMHEEMKDITRKYTMSPRGSGLADGYGSYGGSWSACWDGQHHEEDTSFLESGGEASVDAITTVYDEQGTTLVERPGAVSDAPRLSRAGNQWRTPCVSDTIDIRQPAGHGLYSAGTGAQEDEEEIQTDRSKDERALWHRKSRVHWRVGMCC